MVLVAILGILGIILFQVLSYGRDAVATAQYFATVKEKEISYYVGRSTVDIVRQSFSQDDEKVDSYFDFWATDLVPFQLKEGIVEIKIEDEERFFNPLYIINTDGTIEEKHFLQFQRLLEIVGVEPDKANAVVDWMDEDNIVTMPGGDEGGEQPVKNAPLDSLGEMLLMPGLEADDFSGKTAAGQPLPPLRNQLSVYSNGKVNINTASFEILRSLDEEISESVATQIIEKRKEKAIEKLDDLLDLPGFNRELLYRLTSLADVKSQNFKISAMVNMGETKTLVTAIISRDSIYSPLKYFKLE